MDPLAVGLVLASAVLHALWNVRLHGADDRVAAMAMSGGGIGRRAAAPPLVLSPPSGLWELLVIDEVSRALYGLALAGAYLRGDLSVTYPVGRGSAPLMATLAAVVVVGQQATARTIVAASLVAMGLGLLAFRSHRSGTLAATGLALVVGATVAAYSVVDARAVREGRTFNTSPARSGSRGVLMAAPRPGSMCTPACVAPPGRGGRGRQRRCCVLVLFAFRLAPVGRVATLREVSVVIAVLLAREEHPGPIGWAGIGAVVAGAVLATA